MEELEPLFKHLASSHIGISVGKGWIPLVLELHEQLLTICPDYQIIQVKEKFGTLRYYAQMVWPAGQQFLPAEKKRRYDAFHVAISTAENRSGSICELCGGPGKLREGGWMLTLCNAHYEQREKERAKRT